MDARIAASHLTTFAEALLAAGGFTVSEAKNISESLVLSELMGHGSHGIMRVKEYLADLKNGNTVSGAKLTIIQETPCSLLADGQRGAGQTIMPVLLEKMQNKLSSQAVITAAVRNCGHIGRIGEWVEKPAYDGYPGLLMVNDNGGFFASHRRAEKRPLPAPILSHLRSPCCTEKFFLPICRRAQSLSVK